MDEYEVCVILDKMIKNEVDGLVAHCLIFQGFGFTTNNKFKNT